MDLKFECDENGIAYTYVNGTKGTLNAWDTQALIREIASKCTEGDHIYVETGSYLGCSSVLAGLVSSSNTMCYAHDVWDYDSLKGDSIMPPRVLEGDYFKIFYDNIRQNKLQKKVIPIRGDSKYTLGAIHKDASIDIAFVDGDHSFDGIVGDLVALRPKMKSGGVILCHDCTKGSDTRKGLEMFTRDFEDIPGTHGMVKIVVD